MYTPARGVGHLLGVDSGLRESEERVVGLPFVEAAPQVDRAAHQAPDDREERAPKPHHREATFVDELDANIAAAAPSNASIPGRP